MGWFNYYGLAVMAVVMIPNIIYAVKNKGNVADTYNNKLATRAGRQIRLFRFYDIQYSVLVL